MVFAKEKHVKFWRMNATLLPHHYLSNDGSRMTLGYFIVAALDLLGGLDAIGHDEKQGWIDWIYSCQRPDGGFRGFTGTDLGENGNEDNSVWDPSSVPATFFALTALLVLDDPLERVGRAECLSWLSRMQRSDGSFGEILGHNDVIEGGRDLRFCCCAAGIVYILGDTLEQNGGGEHPINLKLLVQYVLSCQSYDGGFGESPTTEPHSGLTYCAIASLSLVQKLDKSAYDNESAPRSTRVEAVRWMLDRQTDVLEEEEDKEEDDDEDVEHNEKDDNEPTEAEHEEQATRATNNSRWTFSKAPGKAGSIVAGFSGREGKIADTCYCFWNMGALAILGQENMIDSEAMRKYLLEKTQHMIGGFGKGIGAPPDVMHSYLGLAALSLIGEHGIKPIDPNLCISREAVEKLAKVSWKSSSSAAAAAAATTTRAPATATTS